MSGFQGNTCLKGHVSERRKNGNCIQCEKERYQSDPDYRERRKAQTQRRRERLKADPERHAQLKDYQKAYSQANRARLNEQQSQRYHGNPDLRIRTRLRRLGIPVTDTLVEQIRLHPGVCDICSAPGDGRWGELAIDHCHTSHTYRGMLCSSCNRALGMFKDDPETMRKALSYLQNRKLVPNEWVPG